MSLRWFRSLGKLLRCNDADARRSARSRSVRARLEMLEDRSVPAIAAGNIQVVQNTTADNAAAISLITNQATSDFAVVGATSTRGDYAVQIGASASDDLANGILISSVRQNGRDNGEVAPLNGARFVTSATAQPGGGAYSISVSDAPNGTEFNTNVSAAYFPYADGWVGGITDGPNGGAFTSITASSGITLANIANPATGQYTLTLPGVNAATDGILLVASGKDEDNFALQMPNANGTWTIFGHDNGADSTNYESDPIAFVYVPKTSPGLIVGRVMGDLALGPQSQTGTFTVTNPSTGVYRLSIPGESPTSGVLILSPEGGGSGNSDNILTYEANGGFWDIQSRDLPSSPPALQTIGTTIGAFSFVFIPIPPPANAVVDVNALGQVTYTAGNGITNALTVTESGGTLTFMDTAESITVTAAAAAAGFTGGGSNTVSGPSAAATSSVQIDVGAQDDSVILNSISKSITVIGGGGAGDTLVMNQNITGTNVALTGFNSISQAAGRLITATSVTLAGNAVGTAGSPIATTAATISATATGGLFLAEADGAAVTASVTGTANASITSAAGALSVAGSITTSGNIVIADSGTGLTITATLTTTGASSNVSLSSPNAINLQGNIAAGPGTVTIAANTDGAGAEGFTQAAANSIVTTNTSASAVSLTVNTAGGGTGNATVSEINANSGTLAINANRGSIVFVHTGTAWAIGATAATYGGTQFLRAATFNLSTIGAGGLGTSTVPLQLFTNAAGRSATLTSGTGGIFIADNDANGDLNVSQANAAGGDILLVANSSGNMVITGQVTTASGNIRILTDDLLTLQSLSVLGGAGFSGTVLLQANFDGTNEQGVTMVAGSSIVTTNATANAVRLEGYGLTNATNAPQMILGNITAGSGGGITVISGARAGSTGQISQLAGTSLNAGPTGTITLTAVDNPIGTAAAPITVAGGTVIANTTSVATSLFAGQLVGNIFVTSTAAASMQATTTTAGTRIGAISLTTTSGALTLNGPVITDDGAITLTGAAGVNVNAAIGDANTSGAVTISGGTGNVNFTVNPDRTLPHNFNITSGTIVENVSGAPLNISNLNTTGAAWNLAINSLSQFDQIDAVGTVNLGNASLNVSLAGYTAALNDTFIIVNNDGADAVTGTFNGRPEGSFIVVGFVQFQISYNNFGADNDVVLRVSNPNFSNPGQLDFVAGTLIYTGSAGTGNQLSLSLSGGQYTFSDPGQNAINVTAAAAPFVVSNVGTTVVVNNSASITALSIDTGDSDDATVINNFDKPLTIVGGGQANDTVNFGSGVTVIVSGNVTISGVGTVSQSPGTILNLGAGTFNATASTAIGSLATPIRTTAGLVIVSSGVGGAFVTETDGAGFIGTATGAGNLNFTNLAGTLTIAGATSTATGNITVSSADAVTLNANLGATGTTSGTITIQVNTNGAGTDGFTQATGASINTTNNTNSAVTLTVNTAGGGTGNATIGVSTVTGRYNISSNGGSILWNSALGAYAGGTLPGFGGFGGNDYTSNVSAGSYFFSSTGAGSIGDSVNFIQARTAAGRVFNLSSGTGGIFVATNNAALGGGVNITQAVAQGAGPVRFATNAGGSHSINIQGPVSSGSGDIFILANDTLTVETAAVIGGGSFSGTVRLYGNFDAGSTVNLDMQNSSITTTNTSATAVVIENTADTNAAIILSNITVGNGGTITVNATGVGTAVGAKTGQITTTAGKTLNAGANGTVRLVTRDYNIGTAALPIRVAGGNVIAVANSSSAAAGNIFVTGTAATAMQATTTTSGTNIGNVTLATTAGVLTINGPTNADSGTISLTGAGGVAVNAVLGDSNTTGGVTASATSGSVNFSVAPATQVPSVTVNSGNLTETVSGPLVLPQLTIASAAGASFTLTGPAAFDQFAPTGAVNITGSTLTVTASSFSPTNNQTVILVNGGASAAITGQFVNADTPAETDNFPVAGLSASVVAKILYGFNDGSDTNNIAIQFTLLNANPTAAPDTANAVEDGPAVPIDVLANDTDPDIGQSLTVTGVSGGAAGTTITFTAGGVTYNPGSAFQTLAAGQTTTDTFNYTISDGAGGTATGSVTVTITGVNDAPTVTNPTTTAVEDGAAVTTGVLGDDIDSNNDPSNLTYIITSQPSEGSVTVNPGGTLTFSPGTGFQDLGVGETRVVNIGYKIIDSSVPVTAGATQTVTASAATGGFTVSSGDLLQGLTAAVTGTALAGDEGTSSNPLTLTDGSFNGPNVIGGVAIKNNTTLTYTLPTAGAPNGWIISSVDIYSGWQDGGRDNIDVTVSYATASAPNTFLGLPAISFAPTSPPSGKASLAAPNSVLIVGATKLRFTFGNQENGYVGYRELDAFGTPAPAPSGTQPGEQTVVTASAANGGFPVSSTDLLQGRTATVTGTALAGDEGTSANSATLTDGSFNGPDAIGGVAIRNNTTLTFSLPTAGAPNGWDLSSIDVYSGWQDGGRDNIDVTVSYASAAAPTTFISLPAVSFAPTGRSGKATVSTANSLVAKNAVSVQFTFGAQENGYVGYRELDVFGTASAPALVNVPGTPSTATSSAASGGFPVSSADLIQGLPAAVTGTALAGDEGTSANSLTLTDGSFNGPDVIGGVAIRNNTTLTFTLPVSAAGYTLSSIDVYSGWQDGGRDNQDYSVLYATIDAPTTFFPLTSVSFAPTPRSGKTSITSSNSVLANNVVKVQFVFPGQENGYVGYREIDVFGTPSPVDNSSATGTVSITVSGVNDPPSAGSATLNVNEDTGNVTTAPIAVDPDTTTPNITVLTTPTEGTITNNGNGTFTFSTNGGFQDLNQGQVRTVSLTYQLIDDAAPNVPGTISVVGQSQFGLFTVSSTDMLQGLTPANTGTLLNGLEGTTNNSAILTDGSAGSVAPPLNTTIATIENGTILTYTLPAATFGQTISSIDLYSGWQDGGRDRINVDVFYATTAAPNTFQALTSVAYEPTTPPNGRATISASNSIVAINVVKLQFVFNNQENGHVGYREIDVFGSPSAAPPASASGSVTVNVTGVNDLPTAAAATLATEENASVTTPVLTNDVDAEDDPLSLVYSIVTPPTSGVATSNGNGTFTFNPNGQFNDLPINGLRTVSFVYRATDARGGFRENTVTVTVIGRNNAPTASPATLAAETNGPPVTTGVLTDDVDSNHNPGNLTYAIVTPPTEGSAVSNGDGTFTFDPGADFQDLTAGQTRDVTFTYSVIDVHPTAAPTTIPQAGTFFYTSPSDLIQGMAAAVTGTALAGDEGTSNNSLTLTDGAQGAPSAVDATNVSIRDNTTLTYSLDTTTFPQGFVIGAFSVTGGWRDGGRDDQRYVVRYSLIGAPNTFIDLATVNYAPPQSNTQVIIAPASGVLLSGVAKVQFFFGPQENGYAGYREIDVYGFPIAATTATVTVTVTGVSDDPPVLGTPATDPVIVPEGGVASNSGTYSDPNTGDNVTITATMGGNPVGTITKTGTDNGTWSWSYNTTDGPVQSGTVVITASDGGNTVTTSFQLVVNNVAPNFSLAPDATLVIADSGVFTRNNIPFTDPGAETWTGTVNYGDGGGNQTLTTINQVGKTFSLSHSYQFGGVYTVTVTLDDQDGGVTTRTMQVNVPQPTHTYADDDWAGFTQGQAIADADPVAAGNQPAVFGYDAFASANTAIFAVAPAGLVTVNGGTYAEAVTVNKNAAITLQPGTAGNMSVVFGALNDTLGAATITLNTVTFSVGAGSVASPIGGNGSLVKNTGGTLLFTGSLANTYSGGTTVNDGTLALAKTAGVNGLAGPVVIGDNLGGSATVKTAILRVDQSNQIPDGASISFFGNDGRLFIASGSETIANPAPLAGGDIKVGGTLTLPAAFNQTAGSSVTMAGGVLNIGAAGTLDFALAGTLQGSGTIYTKMLTSTGTIDPSSGATDADVGNASPGRINIRGNLQLTGSSVTNLDLGSSSSDQLNVGINTALPLPAGSYSDLSNYDLDPYLRGDAPAVTEQGRRGVNDLYNINGAVRLDGALNMRPIIGQTPANTVTSMNFVWRAMNVPTGDLDPRGANLSSVPSDFSSRNSFTAAGVPVAPNAPASNTRFEPRFMGSGGQANAIGQSVSAVVKTSGGADQAVLSAPAYVVGQAKVLTLTPLAAPATSTPNLKMTKQLWNALRDSHTRVTVTVTNTTGAALTGPFYLEITSTPFSVAVFNQAGKTQGNKPYVVVVPRDAAGNALSTLANGASATVEVDLLTPVALGKTTALTANVLFGGLP